MSAVDSAAVEEKEKADADVDTSAVDLPMSLLPSRFKTIPKGAILCAEIISSIVPDRPIFAPVVVHLRPTGNAPILKQPRFNVGSEKTIMFILDFLRKQLRLARSNSLVSANTALQEFERGLCGFPVSLH